MLSSLGWMCGGFRSRRTDIAKVLGGEGGQCPDARIVNVSVQRTGRILVLKDAGVQWY